MPLSQGYTPQQIWEYTTRTLTSIVPAALLVSSANVKASALTERTELTNVLTVVKEFHVQYSGIVRIYYDFKIGGAGDNVLTEIAVNGTVVATGLSSSTTYVTENYDFAVMAGNIIQIKLSNQNNIRTAYLKNAKLAYDIDTSGNDVITD